MTQYCDQHSGMCATTTFLSKEIDNIKKELHEQKGYNLGMFNSSNQEIREVNQKLRDEMKEMKKEIQAEIKIQLDDFKTDLNIGLAEIKTTLTTTDTKKENKFNMYLSSGIFPTIVIVIGFLIQYYFGK